MPRSIRNACCAAACLLLLTMPVALPAAASGRQGAEATIRQELADWMTAFNDRDAEAACSLFAPDLRYNVQGLPEQTYKEMCARLHRSLAGGAVSYRYSMDIDEVMVSGDLAVVRLVWYLTVSRPGAVDVTTPEQGMDVFRHEADGSWKIIRFISYGAQT